MTRTYWLTLASGLALLPACGDDTASSEQGGSSESSSSESNGPTTAPPTSTDTDDPSSSSTDAPEGSSSSSSTTGPAVDPDEAEFVVTIENISGNTWLPSSFSPGVWVEHDLGSTPVFLADQPDRGQGLALLAEDGDPSELVDALEGAAGVRQVGVFEIPVDADEPRPIAPGERFEFRVTSTSGGRFSLFSKLLESNDVVLGTGPNGVALWTNGGAPQPSRDVSINFELWNVGSEADQPPGAGGYQPGPDRERLIGPPEGVGAVSRFVQSTRQLPQAAKVARVDVVYDEKTELFTVTLLNLGATIGSVYSPFSRAIGVLHAEGFGLVPIGISAATVPGFAAFAEQGDPTTLATTLGAAPGVDTVIVTETGATPDGSITIVVDPTTANRFFSIATQIVETNDAVIATPVGVALLDQAGVRRSTAEIEADFDAVLAIFDAGTEANEVPGAGPTQFPREGGIPSGPNDSNNTIRYYSDPTNDLAGPYVGGLLDVSVVPIVDAPGQFTVTVTNTSGNSDFRALFSPVVYAVHDGTVNLFTDGVQASPSLEALAEDGDPRDLLADLAGESGALAFGIPDYDGSDLPSPIVAGDGFTFEITGDAVLGRYLTLATGLIPSNDTFVSLGEVGIPLYDDEGAPLSAEALETAIASALSPWDAGTEVTQAGAVGRDQRPRGNGGANEGPGIIRAANDDAGAVWVYPEHRTLVRVTIAPVEVEGGEEE